jgi:hypothetical protein
VLLGFLLGRAPLLGCQPERVLLGFLLGRAPLLGCQPERVPPGCQPATLHYQRAKVFHGYH